MTTILMSDIEAFRQNSTVNTLQKHIKAKQEENNRKFNIFKVLRLDSHEIRHSNFLAWLLNPNETHGFGSLFLDKFLNNALGESCIDDYKNIEIRLEYPIDDNGRIDILLFNNDFVCVIENKYGSTEHDEQCKRYKKFIEQKSQFKNRKIKKFIFLDLKEPDKTLLENQLSGYKAITYKQVKEILEDIINSDIKIETSAYQVIEQYITILKEKYPMRDAETLNLCKEIYKQYQKTIDTICENCSIESMQEDVEKALKEIITEKAGYQNITFNEPNLVKFLPSQIKSLEKLKFGKWEYNNDYVVGLDISNFRRGDINVNIEVVLSPIDKNFNEQKEKLINLITLKTGIEFNKSSWTGQKEKYKYVLFTKEDWLNCQNTEQIKNIIIENLGRFPMNGFTNALNEYCNN